MKKIIILSVCIIFLLISNIATAIIVDEDVIISMKETDVGAAHYGWDNFTFIGQFHFSIIVATGSSYIIINSTKIAPAISPTKYNGSYIINDYEEKEMLNITYNITNASGEVGASLYLDVYNLTALENYNIYINGTYNSSITSSMSGLIIPVFEYTGGNQNLLIILESIPIPPIISDQVPANRSTNITIPTNITMTLTELEGESVNWSIETSPDIGNTKWDTTPSNIVSYQEDADETTGAGMEINHTDGDWATWAHVVELEPMFFNYTEIPDGAINAVWKIREGENLRLHTTNEHHFNTTNGLKFKYYAVDGDGYIQMYNYTSSSYQSLYTVASDSFYEEAVYWIYNRTNGTKSCKLDNVEYETNYTWYINATDGRSTINEVYWFTTGAETGDDDDDDDDASRGGIEDSNGTPVITPASDEPEEPILSTDTIIKLTLAIFLIIIFFIVYFKKKR